MGAWIETIMDKKEFLKIVSHPTWVRGLKLSCSIILAMAIFVAPYMGAWIETRKGPLYVACHKVAPYMGAWIETDSVIDINPQVKSHPTWVRGLKPLSVCLLIKKSASHPTWVRGLKLDLLIFSLLTSKVAPYMGAWIETIQMWLDSQDQPSRTLHGCVD